MSNLQDLENYLEYAAIVWLTVITMLIIAGSHK
jgi:hypothetical protein